MKRILLFLSLSIMLFSVAFAETSSSSIMNKEFENQILNKNDQLSCTLQKMLTLIPSLNNETTIPLVLQSKFFGTLTSEKTNKLTISNIRFEKGFVVYEMLLEIWEGGVWVESSKETYYYDANWSLVESIGQIWDGSSWVNYMKVTYSYDGYGYMSEMLMQMWEDGSWVDYMNLTVTYYSNGAMDQLNMELWMVDDWILMSRTTYTYDANWYLIEDLTESLDWVSGELVYSNKSTYTYDGNGNHIEMIFQTWEAKGWVNDERTTWQYDANNYETERLEQYWFDSDWVNSARHSFTYDGNGNMTDDLRELWSSGSWVNDQLDTYNYDANGNMIQNLRQDWNGSWVDDRLITCTYDSNGNLTEELWQYWESSRGWVNEEKYTYTYLETAIDDIPQIEDNLACFPNPFNPEIVGTTISFHLPVRAEVNLAIYNVKGQLVKTLIRNSILDINDHSYVWNGKNENGQIVKSGVYFYKLQSDNNSAVKRILLMK